LADLPIYTHPDLIVGMEHSEDAGVYRLRDDLAIIQTVDFFTPIVDDPYTFGQIAAANSLSDIYAKGGKPITAMNVVCFPVSKMDISVLREIMRGGLDKMREAEVALLGGHSVADEELKYGLSVTGVIHPERVILNRGCRAGDKLVLTKPLGTGIMGSALKAEMAGRELLAETIHSMTALNRKAAELMLAVGGVHACTDVTGFGLLGHACEMIEGAEAGMTIESSSVPCFNGVRELIEAEIVPGGLERNRAYRLPMIDRAPAVPSWRWDLLFDPQTSGGLLISIEPGAAVELVRRLHAAGIPEAAIIGEVAAGGKGRIRVV